MSELSNLTAGAGSGLPGPIIKFVRGMDWINLKIGRFAMYLIFAMMAVLLWSSISKTFFTPSLWTLELAQFTMVAYYILGGPYSMQGNDDSHVRMDLFYGTWSPKQKAMVDAVTVICLLFFLGVLLHGAIASTAYALGYFGLAPYQFFLDLIVAFFTGGPDGASEIMGTFERSNTAWRPFMWPIKIIICLGISLMLLQTLSEFFKDIARIRGEEI